MEIYNRCSLCFEGGTEEFYNKMINYNSLVLCPSCYERYKINDYNKMTMSVNSIRMYRRFLEKQVEDNKLLIESNKIACENLNKIIEKLQKENKELKTDVEFYKEISMKGGQ